MAWLGWLAWAALSALLCGASYALAALLREVGGEAQAKEGPAVTGTADRIAAAVLLGLAGLVAAFQLCDLAGRVTPWTVGAVVGGAAASVLAFALTGSRAARVRSGLRYDLGAPRRLLRALGEERDPSALLALAGALMLLLCGAAVVGLRSWQWDPQMYHTSIIAWVVQEGTLGPIGLHFPQMRGFPKAAHLVGVWNVLFTRDSTLDDSVQLPFALLGWATITAWCRRLGAGRIVSAALGGSWLLLPAVFLQLPSPHVDVAMGALFCAAVYFWTGRGGGVDRWLSLLALGLYAGTKHTGLFHLALCGPFLLVGLVAELRRAPAGARAKVAVGQALSVGAAAFLGLYQYVENWRVHGNPLWPFALKVPLAGKTLPGVYDPSALYGGPPGAFPYFFGIPGDLRRWLSHLVNPTPVYWPDVREDFFGIAFLAVLLPALAVTVVLAIRRPRAALPIAFLFVASMGVPSAHWARYAMGASCAGLLAVGFVHAQTRWRTLRVALSAVLVAFVGLTLYRCVRDLWVRRDYYVWPKNVAASFAASAAERAVIQVAPWNLPRPFAEQREADLSQGDVLVFESSGFLGELLTRDYRARVLYLPSEGVPPPAWVRMAVAHRPRWVVVRRGSALEQLVSKSPNATPRFSWGDISVYLFPRSG